MTNIVIIAIVAAAVIAACAYIHRQKKKGVMCIGCPSAGACPHRGSCGGCAENKR